MINKQNINFEGIESSSSLTHGYKVNVLVEGWFIRLEDLVNI